jgi:hypothetical protein
MTSDKIECRISYDSGFSSDQNMYFFARIVAETSYAPITLGSGPEKYSKNQVYASRIADKRELFAVELGSFHSEGSHLLGRLVAAITTM